MSKKYVSKFIYNLLCFTIVFEICYTNLIKYFSIDYYYFSTSLLFLNGLTNTACKWLHLPFIYLLWLFQEITKLIKSFLNRLRDWNAASLNNANELFCLSYDFHASNILCIVNEKYRPEEWKKSHDQRDPWPEPDDIHLKPLKF